MTYDTPEAFLGSWIEAVAEVAKRLSNKHGRAIPDLLVQQAAMISRGTDEPTDLLDHHWTADELENHVAAIDFGAWVDTEELLLEHSLLPLDAFPRRADEERIKIWGEQWLIHKYDPDPFPFLPHAHNQYEGVKMDLRNGKIYRKREFLYQLPRKRLLAFRDRVKRTDLPPIID